jgi:hypothetical protein
MQHNDRQTINQICNMLGTILRQNYFAIQDNCYQPDKDVAMGSPLSGTVAEIVLQHLEGIHTKPLLDSKNIIFYSRYVDDIIIIYYANHANPETIIRHANSIHNNVHLTPTLEADNQISFLDLLIIRKAQQLEIDVFRKPTTTDTTINYLLTHKENRQTHNSRFYLQLKQRILG